MYFKLVIIFFIVLLTYICTRYALAKSSTPPCKTEYFARAAGDAGEQESENKKRSEQLEDICILCNRGDDISMTSDLNNIFNRLSDYYY